MLFIEIIYQFKLVKFDKLFALWIIEIIVVPENLITFSSNNAFFVCNLQMHMQAHYKHYKSQLKSLLYTIIK